ncbi:MAG: 3-hydroxyacyl-ACP dehydratase FabZ [Anaerovoracaceae bacterium]|jgi:3-hydroxyacyl-[acyl-carrier-protein] dehydratase|nr:3-hydroxyacyl-ACP dehydratase FabZ [Anaerovoracaceae bacterium]
MELDINEIKKILPHRYPFLLVDRITELEPGKSARGIKCVSANEMQFMGHFPDYPVMPGVLVLEAMAQTGAVAILVSEEYRGKIALFGGVNKCRFRKEVMPGDVLELFCEISAVRGPVGFGKARATVNGETAAEAELSFVIKA